MDNSHGPVNALYYTCDHEWVNFHGSLAYVGVCAFKLTGIKRIQRVVFESSKGPQKKGDLLATFFSEEYKIPVHMPVDGEVLGYNEDLLGDRRDIVLQQPEKNGWVAFIFPSARHERNGLLLPEQYAKNNKPIL